MIRWRTPGSLAATLIAVALLAPSAQSQIDMMPGLWAVDGDVRGMAIVEDTLYVAGLFDAVGPPTGMLGFFSRDTGEAELGMPRLDSDQLNTEGVRSIIDDGQGGLFIGGKFRFMLNGYTYYNVIHMFADGGINESFRPNPRLNDQGAGHVAALALVGDDSGATLYIGGRFSKLDGSLGTVAREDLATVDLGSREVGPLSFTFERPPASAYGVRTMVSVGDALYIGGLFQSVNDLERKGLAAIDRSTGEIMPWDANLASTSGPPMAIHAVLGDSTLYVAGRLASSHGIARNNIVELRLADASSPGGSPTAWNPQFAGSLQEFFQLVVVDDFVWAAADLVQQGVRPLARIDRHTGALTAYFAGGGLWIGRSITYDPGGPDGMEGPSGQGLLYLGASRKFDDGRSFPVVAAIDPASGQHAGFELMGGPEGLGRQPRALHVEPGGRLVVGGPYYFMGGFRQNGMAAFDLTTGRALEDFPFSLQGEALRASPDGRFLYRYSISPFWLLLDEFDLATRTVRDFTEPGPLPPPPDFDWPDDVYVANARSGLEIEGDTLFVSLSGGVAMDRSDATVIWQTGMASVGTFHLDPGTALLIPAGEDSAFGSDAPTLILSGPFEHGPVSDLQDGFFALNALTGELSDWYPTVHPLMNPLGFAAEYQPATAERPASLWLGGKFSGEVEGQMRRHVVALDPATAALQPFELCVGGSGGMLDAVHAIITMPEGTTLDGQQIGGTTYLGGSLVICPWESTEGWSLVVTDPVSGEHKADWHPRLTGMSIGVRSLLYSERHGALFVGGRFTGALGGSGHSGIVAVSPYGWQPPVTTEPGGAEQPHVASLSAPFPNPARSGATVTLSLPQSASVEVALYDVLGRRVAVVHDGALEAGEHALTLDASRLAAGVYVVRAAGEGFSESKRITVVR